MDRLDSEYKALGFAVLMCKRRGYINLPAFMSFEAYKAVALASSQNLTIFNPERPMLMSETNPIPVPIIIHRTDNLSKIDYILESKVGPHGIVIDPSGSGVINHAMAAVGIERTTIEVPPGEEDARYHAIKMFCNVVHPIVIYHSSATSIPSQVKAYSFARDTHKSLIEFHLVSGLQMDILNNVLQPTTIEYIPQGSKKAKEINSHYGANNHSQILATDPVAKYFNANPGDLFRFVRANQSVHYRKVKKVSLETKARKPQYSASKIDDVEEAE